MNYWMISLARNDMMHCLKKGIFGREGRSSIAKVKKGDLVICYVTKECKIIGSGKITSDYYMDDSPIFLQEGHYVDRFDFSAKTVPTNKEIEIKKIVENLGFVTNKAYWSVFFRSSLRLIPKDDYDYILSKLG